MRRFLTITATATGGLLAVVALAAAPEAPATQKFPISVADLEAKAAARFAAADANADGVIDAAEFAAHAPEPWQGLRMHGHPKGPGFATPEARERLEAERAELDAGLFDAFDRDANGALSREEFAEQQAVRIALHRQRLFERLDDDGNGVLDRDEFPSRRGADLDRDGDGQISREEMRARHRGAEG